MKRSKACTGRYNDVEDGKKNVAENARCNFNSSSFRLASLAVILVQAYNSIALGRDLLTERKDTQNQSQTNIFPLWIVIRNSINSSSTLFHFVSDQTTKRLQQHRK